eukprot:TRINITY_DN4348_c0_g1_i6.p1 TRINITY_DN4348_c0_g1~~TRINITY_DN4348_c0_g1_i6.p1  ORF type:complete len:1009 (+),score=227.54 TRINITY_DN4348_c0_g1_i6:56-3082(+)
MGVGASALEEDSLEFHNVFIDLAKAARANNTTLLQEILNKHTEVLPALLRTADENGNTALALACREGRLEIVKALLFSGSDVNQENNQQYTPIMHAVWSNQPEIIKFLVSAKADVNHQQTRNHGLTALIIAAEKGYDDCAEVLLQNGANPSARRLDGKTAFHVAATKGYTRIAHLLLQHGIGLGIKDNDESTALMLADAAKHNIVSMLLSSPNPAADFAVERAVAIASVLKACILCKKVFKALVSSETLSKKDKSPVTIADYGAQAVVVKQLRAAFPNDPVVGEEDAKELRATEGEEMKNRVCDLVRSIESEFSDEEILAAIDYGTYEGGASGRHWTLDPIDGTLGFLRGEQYAIALSLVVNGEPVIGVLGCPNLPLKWGDDESARGFVFIAVKGQGAFMRRINDDEETSIFVSPTSDFSQVKFCESVESGHTSHSASEKISKELGVTESAIRMDSQCKYAALSRGDAEIYLRLPTKKGYEEKIWDHAAGALLIQEAGGSVSDVTGAKLDFSLGRTLKNNRGIIASNGVIHEHVVSVVKRILEDMENQSNQASATPETAKESVRINPIIAKTGSSTSLTGSVSQTHAAESPTARRNPIMESVRKVVETVVPPTEPVPEIAQQSLAVTSSSESPKSGQVEAVAPQESLPTPTVPEPQTDSASNVNLTTSTTTTLLAPETTSRKEPPMRTNRLNQTPVAFVPHITSMSVDYPQGYPNTKKVSDDEFGRVFDFYRRELREKEPILGRTHPTIIRFLFKLGNLLKEHRRYIQSGEYFLRLVDTWKEIKQSGTSLDAANFDSASLLDSLDHVGFHASEAKEYAHALRFYEAAFILTQGIHGLSHPLSANILENLGACYAHLSDTNSALQHFQKALTIRRSTEGTAKEDLARLLHQIANTLSNLGHQEESAQAYQESRVLFTELGASHLDDLASLLDDWGCLCESLKQYEKALELFKESYSIRSKIYGPEHFWTITSMENVFTSQLSVNLEDALETSRQILRLAQQVWHKMTMV